MSARRRNPQRELDWLRKTIVADKTGLIVATQARLDGVGSSSYEDSWADRPVEELVKEIREECADIPGWGVLTALHPSVLSDLELGPRLDAEVAAAVELAARADEHLKRAQALAMLIDEHG